MIKLRKRDVIFLFLIVSFSLSSIPLNRTNSIDPYFTLVAITYTPEGADVLQLCYDYLGRINVDLQIDYLNYNEYLERYIFKDFDICYMELEDNQFPYKIGSNYDCLDFDFIFGYEDEIDYQEEYGMGRYRWYLNQLGNFTPSHSEEQYELCWTIQDYLMDMICPCLPLFSPKEYAYSWDTLTGFDYTQGLIRSWGKMDWSDAHLGQQSINEIVISKPEWNLVNPLQFEDRSDTENALIEAIFDTLVSLDPDKTIWPHLATNWDYLSNTQIRFTLRDDIKWQNDPDGLFSDEYLTAEDIYFTFFCNRLVNQQYKFIRNMSLVNANTIDITIDYDLTTPGNYYDFTFLSDLAKIPILPEHYLNQTQLADGKTPDMTSTAWNTFKAKPFGTGLFKLANHSNGIETTLEEFNDCWKLKLNLLTEDTYEWEKRFGDYSSVLTELRIRHLDNEQHEINEFKKGGIDILTGLDTDIFECNANQFNDYSFIIDNEIQNQMSFLVFNMLEQRDYIGDRLASPVVPEFSIGLCLRKAISYAVNKPEIIEIISGGDYQLIDSPISLNQGKWVNPNGFRYCYKINAARLFTFIMGFDACYCPGCYDNLPEDYDFCSENNTNISVDGYSYLISFTAIFASLLLSLLFRKKLLRKESILSR